MISFTGLILVYLYVIYVFIHNQKQELENQYSEIYKSEVRARTRMVDLIILISSCGFIYILTMLVLPQLVFVVDIEKYIILLSIFYTIGLGTALFSIYLFFKKDEIVETIIDCIHKENREYEIKKVFQKFHGYLWNITVITASYLFLFGAMYYTELTENGYKAYLKIINENPKAKEYFIKNVDKDILYISDLYKLMKIVKENKKDTKTEKDTIKEKIFKQKGF